jgi:protein TonB
LRPRPNNDLRKLPSERRKGIVGSAIIHITLFALLLILAFKAPKQPELEEGILVNFGTDETGIGSIEPSSSPIQEEAAPPVPSAIPVKQNEEPLLTQQNEEAPEIKKVDPEAEKKRLEKIEADRKLKEQMEAERKKKEQ